MRIASEREAIQYLESLVDFTKKIRGSDIRLEPVKRLLKLLGNPEQKFPAVYVSGTSGKGSTATFIASMLHASGFRTGLVLSPHVENYRERFQINGRWISRTDFASMIRAAATAIDHERKKDSTFQPTIFEVLVAAQFLFFSHQHVKIAVIESGIGGNRDATTVCKAIVDVITTIALEHQNFLGKTLAAIARTEASAFHTRALRVIGRCPKQARSVLLRHAGVGYIDAARDVEIRSSDILERGTRCTVMVAGTEYRDLFTSLIGTFQPGNIALAIAAIHQLRKQHWKISDRAIRSGIRRACIRDRFEVVHQRDRTMVFDGAHNPEKMRAFVATFKKIFRNRRAAVLVCIKRGKDVRRMVRILAPICSRVVLTTMHMPHVSPEVLRDFFRAQGFRGAVNIQPDPEKAVRALKRHRLIVVTGSMYLYSIVRTQFSHV